MARGAHVKVLPPLLYVVPLAAAWLIESAAPTMLRLGPGQPFVGMALVACGVALMGWAVVTFRRRGTTVIPWAAVNALATDGPYRFTRNPIYLGDAVAYLGAALWLDSAWALAALPVILVATYRLVIRHEESYLGATFAGAYAAYRRRVRRWI